MSMVTRIIKKHPDLLENADPKNGWTSLHYAGYHGRYLVCVFLIQSGHDREEISLDFERNTPLHLAAKQNQEQTVHYLSQHLRRCLDWPNIELDTPLMVAAKAGHQPCITLLLDFGAEVEKSGKDGNRPIHIAAAYGHLKAIRTLIDRKADTTRPNNLGWTPLDYCYSYQVKEYMSTLVNERRKNANGANHGTSYTPFSKPVQNQQKSPFSSQKTTPNSSSSLSKLSSNAYSSSFSSPGSQTISLSTGSSPPTSINGSTSTFVSAKLQAVNHANAPSAPSPLHHSTILNVPVVAKPQNFHVQQYQFPPPPPSAFSSHTTPASSPISKPASYTKPQTTENSVQSSLKETNSFSLPPSASGLASYSSGSESPQSSILSNQSNSVSISSTQSQPQSQTINPNSSTQHSSDTLSSQNQALSLNFKDSSAGVPKFQEPSLQTSPKSNISSVSSSPSKKVSPKNVQRDLESLAQLAAELNPSCHLESSTNVPGLSFGPPLQSCVKENIPTDQLSFQDIPKTPTLSAHHASVKNNSISQLAQIPPQMSAMSTQSPSKPSNNPQSFRPLKQTQSVKLMSSPSNTVVKSNSPSPPPPPPAYSATGTASTSPKLSSSNTTFSSGSIPHAYNNPHSSSAPNFPYQQQQFPITPPKHNAAAVSASKHALASLNNQSSSRFTTTSNGTMKQLPDHMLFQIPSQSSNVTFAEIPTNSKSGDLIRPNGLNNNQPNSSPGCSQGTSDASRLYPQTQAPLPGNLAQNPVVQVNTQQRAAFFENHTESRVLEDSLQEKDNDGSVPTPFYKLNADNMNFRQAVSEVHLSSAKHNPPPNHVTKPLGLSQNQHITQSNSNNSNDSHSSNNFINDSNSFYELGTTQGNRSMPSLDHTPKAKTYQKHHRGYQLHHPNYNPPAAAAVAAAAAVSTVHSKKSLDSLKADIPSSLHKPFGRSQNSPPRSGFSQNGHSPTIPLQNNPPPIPPKRVFSGKGTPPDSLKTKVLESMSDSNSYFAFNTPSSDESALSTGKNSSSSIQKQALPQTQVQGSGMQDNNQQPVFDPNIVHPKPIKPAKPAHLNSFVRTPSPRNQPSVPPPPPPPAMFNSANLGIIKGAETQTSNQLPPTTFSGNKAKQEAGTRPVQNGPSANTNSGSAAASSSAHLGHHRNKSNGRITPFAIGDGELSQLNNSASSSSSSLATLMAASTVQSDTPDNNNIDRGSSNAAGQLQFNYVVGSDIAGKNDRGYSGTKMHIVDSSTNHLDQVMSIGNPASKSNSDVKTGTVPNDFYYSSQPLYTQKSNSSFSSDSSTSSSSINSDRADTSDNSIRSERSNSFGQSAASSVAIQPVHSVSSLNSSQHSSHYVHPPSSSHSSVSMLKQARNHVKELRDQHVGGSERKKKDKDKDSHSVESDGTHSLKKKQNFLQQIASHYTSPIQQAYNYRDQREREKEAKAAYLTQYHGQPDDQNTHLNNTNNSNSKSSSSASSSSSFSSNSSSSYATRLGLSSHKHSRKTSASSLSSVDSVQILPVSPKSAMSLSAKFGSPRSPKNERKSFDR